MNYKQKYLKYKLKYLNLKKKMFGGMEGNDNSLSPETILGEDLHLNDDELADKIINEAGDNIYEYLNEYNEALNKIFESESISDKDKIDITNKVESTFEKIKEKKINKRKQSLERAITAREEETTARKVASAALDAAERAKEEVEKYLLPIHRAATTIQSMLMGKQGRKEAAEEQKRATEGHHLSVHRKHEKQKHNNKKKSYKSDNSDNSDNSDWSD